MRSCIMVLVVCSFFFIAVVSLNAGTVSQEEPPVVLSKHTEKKLFTVEIRLSGKNLVVGQNSATLILSDTKNVAVTGAEVRVLPVITAHGESTSLRPFVREKSDGLYSVENLYIDIAGNWTVKVMVRKDEITDSVSFDFPGVKRRTP